MHYTYYIVPVTSLILMTYNAWILMLYNVMCSELKDILGPSLMGRVQKYYLVKFWGKKPCQYKFIMKGIIMYVTGKSIWVYTEHVLYWRFLSCTHA